MSAAVDSLAVSDEARRILRGLCNLTGLMAAKALKMTPARRENYFATRRAELVEAMAVYGFEKPVREDIAGKVISATREACDLIVAARMPAPASEAVN